MGRAGGHIDDQGIGSPSAARELADIFGGAAVIDFYGRAEAISDGVIIDPESEFPGLTAKEGFRFPVHFTSESFYQTVEIDEELASYGQSRKARLEDTLMMLKLAISRAPKNDSEIPFAVSFMRIGDSLERDPDGEPRNSDIHLKAVCGPNDDGSPCITIMMPNED